MGIRISKQICYFLKNKDISHLLVKNYQEILDNMDGDDEANKLCTQNLNEIIDSQIITNSMMAYELNTFKKEINKESFQLYQFIYDLYFNDTVKGVCFSTPELIKSNRYDDLIDYYDNSYKPSIKYLKTAIYPISAYVYLGGPFDDKINIGAKLESDHVRAYLQSINPNYHKLSHEKQSKYMYKTSIFKPEVDFIIYHLAKAVGILKNDVTPVIFNKYLTPAIITNWS